MEFEPRKASGDRNGSFVSARDLSRRTSELLDTIREGHEIAVTRHGMPVALIIPYEASRWGPRDRRPEGAEWRDELDGLELSPIQERVLTSIDSCTPLDRIAMKVKEESTALAIALSRLEIARLCEKRMGGYVLTHAGRRVAAALEAPDRAASRDAG
jgi:prevent-host-death family protein